MRQLRFVGPGDDGTVIVETTDAAEQFSLVVDDQLVTAARPAETEVTEAPASGGKETMTEIRPRDIQMRVRAGEDAQALADEAGVELDKIMRFAYPVLQERIRVIDEARRGRARGGDGHPVVFGELFDHRVATLGTEPTSVDWDSFRRPDGGWTVLADFSAPKPGGEDVALLAKFSFALLNRTVTALNDVAADLLAGNPLRILQPRPAAADDEATPGSGLELADSGTGARPESARLAAVPDPEPLGVPAADQRHSESRSPIRLPSRRQKAHTHPVPVAMDDDMFDDLFDQEALDPAGNASWHEPPLPLDLGQSAQVRTGSAAPDSNPPANPPAGPPAGPMADPAAGSEAAAPAAEESGHRRSGRSGDKPRMPSWDDILLGVRRKSD
ncbi:MAG: hypothetical protein JWN47_2709 [Frankiales bacterium]|nr:hypothetical protein [Frankiales bacterium]